MILKVSFKDRYLEVSNWDSDLRTEERVRFDVGIHQWRWTICRSRASLIRHARLFEDGTASQLPRVLDL